MDKFSASGYQPGRATNSRQPEESKPVFQFRFGHHSQKPEPSQTGAGFAIGLGQRRSNLGELTQSSKLTENVSQRGFDRNHSQSPFKLGSRHFDSHAFGSSAYPHDTPEIVDRKPHSATIGTFVRCKEEPVEIGLHTRPFASASTPSVDYPKMTVKVEDASRVDEEQDLFGPATVKLRLLSREVAQQREQIVDLESRLVAKTEENSTLTRTLAQTEMAHRHTIERHRDALERAAKNYSALKSELEDFGRRTESSTLVISEAKATMDSLVALRNSARVGLRDLESMIDADGRLILGCETRNMVHELRSELVKTEQVADLLRDKLHDMGSDLAEARSRILELQELTASERNRSESVTLKLRQSADQMVEVTRHMQEQKHESIQAAAKAYEMEQQLVHTQTRLQEAQSMITSMKEEMDAQEEFHREQDAKLRTLRHTIDFQEDRMKDLDARARKAEDELVQSLTNSHELQGRLDSAKEVEKHLTQQATRLLSERDEAKASTERQLAEVQASEKALTSELAKTMNERDALTDKLKLFDSIKRELDIYRDKYTDSQVSLKVVQERFDDQCVTLAASKETIGELQERIHATERQTLEKSTELEREVARLRERQALLQTKIDQAEKELGERSASLLTLQVELSRKEGAFQARLETEQTRANEALGQLQDAKSTVESLLTQVAQKDHHAQEAAKRLTAVEATALEREREVASQKLRISELEAIEKRLLDRAMSITQRYEDDDLSDDEKALVALLMQKARAIHDREMVDKNNEIKRRDNIIKQHEARIAQLEGVLARRIYDESRTTSPKGTDEQGNSIPVDATKGPQGVQSHQSDCQPDPDIRGAEPGVVASSTSATHDQGHIHIHTMASADAFVNPRLLGPGPPPSVSASASASRSTGYYATFAKLCREDTDDIVEFDDDKPPGTGTTTTTGKRVMFADEDGEAEAASARPARRVKQAERTGGDKATSTVTVPTPALASAGTGHKKKTSRRR